MLKGRRRRKGRGSRPADDHVEEKNAVILCHAIRLYRRNLGAPLSTVRVSVRAEIVGHT